MLEFKRFLYLGFFQAFNEQRQIKFQRFRSNAPLNMQIVPSPIIDRIWRILISNSECYKQFCNHIGGNRGILQRSSFSETNPPLQKYLKTLDIYRSQFEEPDQIIWPLFSTPEDLFDAYNGFLYLSSEQFKEFRNSFEKKYEKFKNFKQANSVYNEELKAYKVQTKLSLNNKNLPSEIDESPELTKVISSDDEELRTIESKGHRIDDRVLNLKSVEPMEMSGDHSKAEFEQLNKERRLSQVQPVLLLRNDTNASNYSVQSTILQEKNNPGISRERSSSQGRQSPKLSIGTRNQIVLGGSTDFHGIFSPGRQGDEESKKFESSFTLSIVTLGPLNVDIDRLKKKAKLCQMLTDEIIAQELPPIVIKNFMFDFNADLPLAQAVFNEYKHFMILQNLLDSPGIASHVIRVAQQYHASQTKEYESFCVKFFEPLPRLVGVSIKRNYALTRLSYYHVFKTPPHPQLWPQVDVCFDEELIYSSKLFNMRGYMEDVISKLEKQQTSKAKKIQKAVIEIDEEMVDIIRNKRAMAHMIPCREPEKGIGHIVRSASPTLQFYDNLDSYEDIK